MSIETKSGTAAARRDQREADGADNLRRAPPQQGADGAVLHSGKDQQRAEQRGHENRYDR